MTGNDFNAFPSTSRTPNKDGTTQVTHHFGMTMRDYFAAAALTGMLTDTTRPRFNADTMAADAYRFADAMLAAREGK